MANCEGETDDVKENKAEEIKGRANEHFKGTISSDSSLQLCRQIVCCSACRSPPNVGLGSFVCCCPHHQAPGICFSAMPLV